MKRNCDPGIIGLIAARWSNGSTRTCTELLYVLRWEFALQERLDGIANGESKPFRPVSETATGVRRVINV